MRDNFAAFILTHGRADKVYTFDTLKRYGYTGRVYLVIDDEDEDEDEYRARYGDQVLQFSKLEIAQRTDQYDNFKDRRAILWARNACFDLAKRVGVRFFIQLDDDYTRFLYRRWGARDKEVGYHGWTTRKLDALFEALVRFIETTPALTICLSQGGDHFGGIEGRTSTRLMRKAMNSFVCDTKKPFQFFGRINEDVNTYCRLGNLGQLFFSHTDLQLNQNQTQQTDGGMTDLYLDSGTYTKSFYSIMAHPSGVKIRTMGRTQRRLHHAVSWRRTVPMIIRPIE